jgi:hypothetical protein
VVDLSDEAQVRKLFEPIGAFDHLAFESMSSGRIERQPT